MYQLVMRHLNAFQEKSFNEHPELYRTIWDAKRSIDHSDLEAHWTCEKIERLGVEVVLVGIQSHCVVPIHWRHVVIQNATDLSGATIRELTKVLHPEHNVRRRGA